MTKQQMSQQQMEKVDRYLGLSRNHLEGIRQKLEKIDSTTFMTGMKYSELRGRQEFLEDAASEMTGTELIHTNPGEFGQISWLIAGGGTLITALGTWAYKHYLETKKQDEYLECLNARVEKGMPAAKAAKICSGKVGLFGTTELFPIVVGAGVLGILYFLFKE